MDNPRIKEMYFIRKDNLKNKCFSMQIYSMFYLENKTKNPHKKDPTLPPWGKPKQNTNKHTRPKKPQTNKKQTKNPPLSHCTAWIFVEMLSIIQELRFYWN